MIPYVLPSSHAEYYLIAILTPIDPEVLTYNNIIRSKDIINLYHMDQCYWYILHIEINGYDCWQVNNCLAVGKSCNQLSLHVY